MLPDPGTALGWAAGGTIDFAELPCDAVAGLDCWFCVRFWGLFASSKSNGCPSCF